MKISLKIYIALLSLFLFTGCSEHIPDEHEQRYLDAADSLTLYQNAPYLQKELAGNQKARDLLTLNYVDFKEKYDWNDHEMEEFAEIIQGHVSIAKNLESFNPSDD